MITFADFMNKNFVEWQAKLGKRKTLEEFASFIGVSRPLLSMWMNGTHTPGNDNIKLLSDIFGQEIYDSLNRPRPNPLLQKLSTIWENVPPEKQQQLVQQAEAYEIKNERSKKAPAKRKTTTN